MIKGIDVSAYQSERYNTHGVDFVFIKATEGRSYVNPHQADQAKHGRDAGAVIGFYHFLWPGNIQAQAKYFVEKCASREGDILVVDWETTGSGTRASCAEKDQFIRAVKKLRPTHRVVLYCNRDYWLNHDTTSYAGDGLWIADYVKAGSPRIKSKWLFHQYTDRPVDTNVAKFDSTAELRAWADGKQSGPKYEPFPGKDFFVRGQKSPIVKAMRQRLIDEGCNRYKSNLDPDVIGSGDEDSYEAWQRKYNKAHHKGWSGDALKWPPGPETWDALKVPNV